ncbi:MAG TPA: DUF6600 domain-containing protein, partial [Burkholderiaceae bacterium]|nr:DUF6600 domain-containing protein [Burkholderiaceae bacterium]
MGFVLLLAGAQALAQVDPPGRVARLNHVEGGVSVAPSEGGDWSPAELNRPLTTGDRVWADQSARSEMHIGSTAVRMDSQTSLDLMQLDDQVAQLRLTQGRLHLRVRQLWEGERLEVDTPNLAFVITQPGEYRVEVDPARNLTRVAVASGSGMLYGESGESFRLGAAQQLALTGRNLSQVAGETVAHNDAFDRWADERDRREDQSISARYVSRETPGYQQLDTHGDWQTDANYGPVWYPRVTVVNWAPYRYGQWRWIAPWGWTWIDDAPWGFAPFHYGRWAQIGPRWCWVPGPVTRRPVYAPALVGFAGGSGGGVHWNINASSGRPNVGWFPLGPGEAWRPGYRASPRYIDNVNRPVVIHQGQRRDGYVHHNRPDAVTTVPTTEFDQRRPVRAHWQREREPGAADAARNQQPGGRPWRGVTAVPPSGVAPADRSQGTPLLEQIQREQRERAEQERARHDQSQQRARQDQREQRHVDPAPQQAPHSRQQAPRDEMQRQQQVQQAGQRAQGTPLLEQIQREQAMRQQQEQQQRALQQQQQAQQLQIQAQQQA